MAHFKMTTVICLIAGTLIWAQSGYAALGEDTAPGRQMARKSVEEKEHWNTTDHSKHEALQQAFTSPTEVTQACLSCHTEAALQFHQTIHWTWQDPNTTETSRLGKGGLSINNFCLNIKSNEARCTSCHAGYGWKDDSFDFTDQTKVDCLVCHEQTGTYKKFPSGAGYPVSEEKVFKGNKKTYYPPDYAKVAQSVTLPERENCGVCHFNGGGGDGVKHGDLDSSLTNPLKTLDVHMGTDGENFTCTRCHSTSLHNIAGRVYATPASQERKSLVEDDLASKITCESCHTATPHKYHEKANDHTDKVACQTCHIPSFARVNPTKMWWDWSEAGKKKDGKAYQEKGDYGKPVYDTKKGEFVWEKNVEPEYFWYNGAIQHLTVEDVVDPTAEVKLNEPLGSQEDPQSRIFPFKVHRGKQPYDKVNKTLALLHLFPYDKNDTDAFWKGFDMGKAIEEGMAYADLDYSGEYDFVETSYVYPTTHMVAPEEDALSCQECHTRDNGRMMNLAGFYMPGRDRSMIIDTLGWIIIGLSLAGVLLHAAGRVVSRSFQKGNRHE